MTATYTKDDFTRVEHGPYGLRWSFCYDGECEEPPTVEEAEAALGVKLKTETADASNERFDDQCEEVYFAAESDVNDNTIQTYRVQ